MKRKIFASAALFSLALLAVGCGATQEKKETVEVILPQVRISQVNESDVAQTEKFTATIDPFVTNNISSVLGLRIEKINAEVGDMVRKGQLLVEMDSRQYLQSAVQLQNLETDYARMEELYKAGGISKQQLDAQATQLEVSRHATNNLKENYELLSPISGIVTSRSFDPGDVYVPTGAGGILTVMQIDKLKVMANIPERYFPQVKLGMPVDISLEIYPNETFDGKVSLIYPALNSATRTFEVEITVNNSSDKLRPGMMCTATLAFGTERHVLVPDIAVLKQSGSSERYLFVIDPETSTADRRTVEIGRIIGNSYEIISGVEDGEDVVIAGMQKLIDGDKVKILQ
ncbi:MAG: efflux RND transporter periplasmic adaptor subunit [Rikenellaceae bacterium]